MLSGNSIQGSIISRMEKLLEHGAISKMPLLTVCKSSMFDGSVLEITCEDADRPTIMGFWLGIDFFRNNYESLLR
jgi:hypothetical protein